ncbi:MAG: polysaccharide biosynthesis C-terminal domain-containing protein, partial [Eubacterium sp.]|nr:polysaccharide biosynthesis C-terminal domain-containing protein [Eubacterium sp.]
AKQVALVVLSLSTAICLFCLALKGPILKLIFGSVEDAVMTASLDYFQITAISFPFFSLFQAGSAFFRASGNSKYPMKISVIGNIINIIGNAILIFIFHLGVLGAAISTLVSRLFCFFVIFISLRNEKNLIYLKDYHKIRPDFKLIHKILNIGIPAGIENGMFQFGKLAIQSSVSTLPTYAIAAQAMTIILEGLNGMAGSAIGIGLMTVIGQTLGAGRIEESKYYIVKLTKISLQLIFISCLLVMALTKPITVIAGMESAAADLCFHMMMVITIFKPLVWTFSFVPGYGLRAAGDVRFSMILSSISMWLCRVAVCVFLIRVMGFGPIAVWIGMITDWTVRGICFSYRFLSGRWLMHKVI